MSENEPLAGSQDPVYTPGFQRLLDVLGRADLALADIEDVDIRTRIKVLVHQATQQTDRLAGNGHKIAQFHVDRSLEIVANHQNPLEQRLNALRWLLENGFGINQALALYVDLANAIAEAPPAPAAAPAPKLEERPIPAMTGRLAVRLEQVESLLSQIAADDLTGLTPARIELAREILNQVRAQVIA